MGKGLSDMNDNAGKTALVIGGSRGIGRAIALRLARSGFDIWLTYQGNHSAASEVKSEIEKTGFSCQHCGKCCRRAFGDNRVVLTPLEIEKIQKHTRLSKLEVAGPLIPEACQPEETENEEEDRGKER